MFVPAGKGGGGGEENRDEERGSIELHVETRYLKQRKRERGKLFKQTGVSNIERTDRQAYRVSVHARYSLSFLSSTLVFLTK